MGDREPLPKVFVARTDAEDIAEAVDSARGTTMAERARILEALCRMAAELVSQHPDPRQTLAWQDPLSPETEALLARLRERYRRGG